MGAGRTGDFWGEKLMDREINQGVLTGALAFIGAGNMTEAIVRGVLTAGSFKATELIASDISVERLDQLSRKYAICTTSDNRKAVQEAAMIVLAVKPQVSDGVLAEIRDEIKEKPVISMMAGVTLRRLAAQLGRTTQLIRVMPNLPVQVAAGAIALSPGSDISPSLLASVRGIFDTVGKTSVLSEAMLDAVTGLAASGPAFVAVVIEAMADGGVKSGLTRETALFLAAQTVYGTAAMILETGMHPAELKDRVASPGGTTIMGLQKLEEGSARAAFIAAVSAATERSKELGREK